MDQPRRLSAGVMTGRKRDLRQVGVRCDDVSSMDDVGEQVVESAVKACRDVLA